MYAKTESLYKNANFAKRIIEINLNSRKIIKIVVKLLTNDI